MFKIIFYILKTGLVIRYLARQKGCHTSTVLRQIRRLEHRRDDPLVDAALSKLGKKYFQRSAISFKKEPKTMSTLTARPPKTQNDRTLFEHAIWVLPRLCKAGAILAVADGMEKAIVVRDMPDGSSSKTAVLDTALAQAFALKASITCSEQVRISRYRITTAGRNALQDLLKKKTQPKVIMALPRHKRILWVRKQDVKPAQRCWKIRPSGCVMPLASRLCWDWQGAVIVMANLFSVTSW